MPITLRGNNPVEVAVNKLFFLEFDQPVYANREAFVKKTFSEHEISLIPMASDYVWGFLNSEAERARNEYDTSSGVIDWDNLAGIFQKAQDNLVASIPEIMESMESNEGANFNKIKSAMPKILNAITSHETILGRIAFEIGSRLAAVERLIEMNKVYRAAAVSTATDSLRKVLQSNPDVNYDSFLENFSDEELAVFPIACEYLWTYLNSEASRTAINYDVSKGVIDWGNIKSLVKKAKANLINRIPEIMENMASNNKKSFYKIEYQMPIVLKAIASHADINRRISFEIGSRLQAIEREIEATKVEHVTIENNQDELTTNGIKRSLLLISEPHAITPAQNNLISDRGFISNHPELMLLAVALPVTMTAVCAFTFVYSRAESFGRMGSSFARAINSGITFLKGGNKAALVEADEKELAEKVSVTFR